LDFFSLEKLMDPGSVLGAVALAVVMAIAAIVISNVLTRILTRLNWVIGRLGRRVDETVVRYTVRIKSLVIFIVFAAKSTLANLISGLSLAVYRPFRIGDKVSINGEYGTVEDITLRHTIVLSWQHKRLIIPNEIIDNMTLINYSIIDPVMLCTVELGVSYDSDIDLARSLILEVTNNLPIPPGEGR